MSDYEFTEIEARWGRKWLEDGDGNVDHASDRPKCYCLSMFSYPSGDKLHLGHWYNYVPSDTWARFRRLKGYAVFQPVGFDSFGLPAENAAMANGVPPAKAPSLSRWFPAGLPVDPFSTGSTTLILATASDTRVVRSVGPDGVDDGAVIVYDPTNGTVSMGDISYYGPANCGKGF